MFFTLIRKDLVEHGWVMLLMLVGVAVSVLLALLQNHAAVSGVSALQIVRVALISLVPLISFIMGQRLLVSEYLGRTQRFLESLPIRGITLVCAKFVFGLLFTGLVAGLVLAATGYSARIVDSIDAGYLLLLSIKTFSIAALVWSIVFCFSFCGFIRVALYIALVLVILLLVNSPAFDAERLGPFSIMDSQLFVFERELYPWQDLFETWGITLLFILAGFSLALINEGSLAEQLSKPMSRRDVVVTGLILVAGLLLLGRLLQEPPGPAPAVATSEVLRSTDPPLSVAYRHADQLQAGEQVMSVTMSGLRSLQGRLGIAEYAPVRIVQDNSLAAGELKLDSSSEIAIRADFREYDAYSVHTLATVVLHEQLQHLSNRRLSFELYHWMLDGVSRWWIETRSQALLPAHHQELLAQAAQALSMLDAGWSLSGDWQRITDRVGYPAAEALAYSAIYYLASERGAEVVEQLALSVLLPRRADSSLVTVQSWLQPADAEFTDSTGWALPDFLQAWRSWLAGEGESGQVAAYLSRLPVVQGEVTLIPDATPALRVNLGIRSGAGRVNDAGQSQCRVQYSTISPFDHEMEPLLDEQHKVDCDVRDYPLPGAYGSGDRVYVVLELLDPLFHSPIRIWQDRLNIP